MFQLSYKIARFYKSVQWIEISISLLVILSEISDSSHRHLNDNLITESKASHSELRNITTNESSTDIAFSISLMCMLHLPFSHRWNIKFIIAPNKDVDTETVSVY